ncbi:MAG: ABC transporter ATP-binding protein [Lamprobacter sp.]|uniref:ABC transporter ATP-binding protein n=1 Tax=Lamprobacter sp. TaxID=3100796 RepID=UPI002B263273|nr:ABC transporter ATP-binding protein [Lamprobacter sp.]MEA3642080.1 ABC transporter ATP-binding protein [Lamprobacter sp.]
MPELSKLYRSLAQLQSGAAAVEVIHDDLLDKAGSGTLPRSAPPGLGLARSLEFAAVSYHYPNADHAGLKDISLEIRAGEKIGIVGGTGAGKTTLADLMLGLLAPTQGRIIVDGVPITETNLRAWQQSVGYVPQDIFLTDASVTENIALGVPPQDIDSAQVIRAAGIANIDRFIREELPQG